MRNLNIQEIEFISGGLGISPDTNTSASTSVGINTIKDFANVALKIFGTTVNEVASVLSYGLQRIFG